MSFLAVYKFSYTLRLYDGNLDFMKMNKIKFLSNE